MSVKDKSSDVECKIGFNITNDIFLPKETEPLLKKYSLEGFSHDLNRNRCGTKLQTKTQTEKTGTSWYAASIMVINVALGAGLLNFPQAYDRAGGVFVAICVQAILVALVISALLTLAYCSDVNGSTTYQEVVRSIYGERTRRICSVLIIFFGFGASVTFVIVIGDQFDTVLSSLYGRNFCHYWYMRREFTVVASSTCIILPLAFPKRIDFLKYSSSFGVLAMLYVIFLMIYEYFVGNYTPGLVKTSPTVWTDVFQVVPTICFGYQCHMSSVPIYSCLADRRVSNFLRTVLVAMSMCMLAYSVASSAGYLTFGSHVTSDILESYNAKDPVVMIGIAALGAKIYTIYPVVLFCGRTAIDDLYVQIRGIPPEVVVESERCRRIIIALSWFICSLTLSLLIPNIGTVIEFMGSLAAVFIFVFPGLCLFKVTLKKDPDLSYFKSRFLVIWAMFLLAVGTCIFFLVLMQALIRNMSGQAITGKPHIC
ncbi:putative sodium-coupled neutral amino acid transporter 7 [Limulus polyphemus]|uniref:Sodium-coupled neutral amino acid transporter 7 n=1 Tax=Limulus polyphemus TaxID=6850 RepID=A0ABM1BJA7_LIMPO|nr:putative sodium-coupled neutral amino acid transporter 7 [Limulus polyphemus]